MTASEIIKRLGGAARLSRALELPAGETGAVRVRAWAIRQAIPGGYWGRIAAYSKENGFDVTLEDLAAAHTPPETLAA